MNIVQAAARRREPDRASLRGGGAHVRRIAARPRHNARPFIERALALESPVHASANAASSRAVRRWVDGDIPRAIALARRAGPRASARPRFAQARAIPPIQSGRCAGHAAPGAGGAAGRRRRALPARHGSRSRWEQCHLLEQAEAAARRAIEMRRKEPWAHHALAHVMLTQGRIAEGHAFLQDVSTTWTGLNSFMVTHNWWHQALFALELDRADEVLDAVRPARMGRREGVHAGPDQCGVAAGTAGARRHRRGRSLAGSGQLPRGPAATTTCCRFSTCSTSTAWRAPAGPRSRIP